MFRDPDSVAAPTDIYAVGAVGYFLLTGKPVFDGITHLAILEKHRSQKPRPLAEARPADAPAVSAELDRLIQRCLAKDMAERPATALDLIAELAALPRAGDWDHEDAVAWWRAFRERQPDRSLPTDNAPTETMDVDLGRRSSAV